MESVNVYYFLERETEVPENDDWLSPAEMARLSTMRCPKRRADWRLGRWTAKRALATYFDWPDGIGDVRAIEILGLPNGAPRIVHHSEDLNIAISLSHRAGWGLCALAPGGRAIGCDLEVIEPRSRSFVEDYFTGQEQAFLDKWSSDRDVLVSLMWSAKESVLKTIQTGLTVDTRDVLVTVCDTTSASERRQQAFESRSAAWGSFQAWWAGKSFHGWYRCTDSLVSTFSADNEASRPISLRISGDGSGLRLRSLTKPEAAEEMLGSQELQV